LGGGDELQPNRSDPVEDPWSFGPQVRIDPEPELDDEAPRGQRMGEFTALRYDQVSGVLVLAGWQAPLTVICSWMMTFPMSGTLRADRSGWHLSNDRC
jgi:hypothetical protein